MNEVVPYQKDICAIISFKCQIWVTNVHHDIHKWIYEGNHVALHLTTYKQT